MRPEISIIVIADHDGTLTKCPGPGVEKKPVQENLNSEQAKQWLETAYSQYQETVPFGDWTTIGDFIKWLRDQNEMTETTQQRRSLLPDICDDQSEYDYFINVLLTTADTTNFLNTVLRKAKKLYVVSNNTDSRYIDDHINGQCSRIYSINNEQYNKLAIETKPTRHKKGTHKWNKTQKIASIIKENSPCIVFVLDDDPSQIKELKQSLTLPEGTQLFISHINNGITGIDVNNSSESLSEWVESFKEKTQTHVTTHSFFTADASPNTNDSRANTIKSLGHSS